MLLGNKSCGFEPGVVGKMPYHPDITHLIARSHNLFVVFSVGDVNGTALYTLEYIVTDKGGAESLGLVELIVIYLGLRMMMGRVTGPTSRLIEYFTQHHI